MFLQVFNDLISTISNLVSTLFSMEFISGVSLGSIFLYVLIMYCIVKLFYPR